MDIYIFLCVHAVQSVLSVSILCPSLCWNSANDMKLLLCVSNRGEKTYVSTRFGDCVTSVKSTMKLNNIFSEQLVSARSSIPHQLIFRTLMSQMFHCDFQQHLKAIETLAANLESDLEGLVANLDLILKWTTLRFFDGNPSVLLRALDYLHLAFCLLAAEPYRLHDIEACSFIPYLVCKVNRPLSM